MSRSRPDPQLARRAAAARSLTGGACAPVRPTHPSSALQSTGRQAVKTEGNPVRLVRADLRPHQSNQKTALSRIGRARNNAGLGGVTAASIKPPEIDALCDI